MTELTIISIIATFMAIIVAINVAYNFYSIYDFRKKLERLHEDMNEGDSKLGHMFEDRLRMIEEQARKDSIQINSELDKVKDLNLAYVQMKYQMKNSIARTNYEQNEFFKAIIEEFSNIYHVITHKNSFSEFEFNQIIGAKYWFIAKDILKCEEDINVVKKNNNERMKIIDMRDSIIELYKSIERNENIIDREEKLNPLFYAARNIADALYYNSLVSR